MGRTKTEGEGRKMKMYSQTKYLKEAGANAGIPKRAIRVTHTRKFVGRHQTNRGTMVNLYEIHDSTAWVDTYKFKGVTLDHLDAIAKQGYDVNFRMNDEGMIQTVWYETAGYDYNDEGKFVQKVGTVTDARKQSEYIDSMINELNELNKRIQSSLKREEG